MSHIHLWGRCNNNNLVEIFKIYIFKGDKWKINDILKLLGEAFEPAQIQHVISNTYIETRGHKFEIIISKTIFEVMLHITEQVYTRTQHRCALLVNYPDFVMLMVFYPYCYIKLENYR